MPTFDRLCRLRLVPPGKLIPYRVEDSQQGCRLQAAIWARMTLCGLVMSFVTYAELLKGAARRTRKAEVLCQLGQLVRVVPVFFDTSQTLCHHYAVEANRLRTVGTPISGNDLRIACHALMLGAVLVTNNLREFARIERLRLENWVA